MGASLRRLRQMLFEQIGNQGQNTFYQYPLPLSGLPELPVPDLSREKPRWLHKTCAYWLRDNGFDLPEWHPIITGRAASVHEAKMSLKDRETVSETGIQNYENYIVYWEDL